METNKWFELFRQSKEYALLKEKPLAYFSIEFALSDTLSTYAGGLGVLAGDYIKELSDQNFPAVAVGLYYQSNYGFDPHHIPSVDHQLISPSDQGLEPVLGDDQKPLIIKVPIKDHDVLVKAWLWRHDSIPLYLLDTNIPENDPDDRSIGYKLYDDEKEVRLKQEMVLGIGGFRLLEALHIKPALYHMNEGHSALLELEIIRHEMQEHHIGFSDAIKLASHHVVFTNHTLVPAGHDIFSNELMGITLDRYASELEVPVTSITELGTIKDTHDFSMSVFAMRLAGKINGVSQLHVLTAAKVWPEYALEPVTNGIHIKSWESKSTHEDNKKVLLSYITEETGIKWEPNELLIGWARRMVRYKRPLALFEELEKFVSLAKDKNRPVRVVLAGIAHQADDEGRALIKKLQGMLQNELLGSVVYLSNYNKTLASKMISSCDIWLNTPVVGAEACGTSGMKACLNGVLPITTKDGWMYEVDVNKIGWSVDSDTIQISLLEILEKQVIPAYYAADKTGWDEMIKNGRELIYNNFSSTRMLKDYIDKTYLPLISSNYFFNNN